MNINANPFAGRVDALSDEESALLERAVAARTCREKVGLGTFDEAAAEHRPNPPCPSCGETPFRDGKTAAGHQRFQCPECGARYSSFTGTMYVEAGGVAAAILSTSGNLYTGVCVDTCCTLGICAERNAIFNMLTSGEHEIAKVLVVMNDGRTGAPCGACRELMVQLMPDTCKDIEVMLDYQNGRTTTMGELVLEWWI